jgi:phosphoglycerate dehydrogenase-like enzyme
VELVLTEAAWRRDRERFQAAGTDVRWLRMQGDGTLLDVDDAPVEWQDAAPEVAWGTADLFDEGGPLRPFFALVTRARSLRWFASPAAGFDNPVFAELVRRGVRLTTSHVGDVPIAEYVVRAVLDHVQQASRWRSGQELAEWRVHPRHGEVLGSTWLVYGVGSIGSAVARLGRALGAHVIGVRRSPSGAEPVDEMLTPAGAADHVGRADVVVLTAPSTPATRGLVGAELLASMRPGALLVNIARGDLVDEAALLAALDTGTPGAAVLDVTAVEPLPADSPLWRHPRVTVTPHASGRTTGRLARGADELLENLRRWQTGAPLLHEVSPGDLP